MRLESCIKDGLVKSWIACVDDYIGLNTRNQGFDCFFVASINLLGYKLGAIVKERNCFLGSSKRYVG